jgi:hypothetical protein
MLSGNRCRRGNEFVVNADRLERALGFDEDIHGHRLSAMSPVEHEPTSELQLQGECTRIYRQARGFCLRRN